MCPADAGPSSRFRISPKLCPEKNSLAPRSVPWSAAISQPPPPPPTHARLPGARTAEKSENILSCSSYQRRLGANLQAEGPEASPPPTAPQSLRLAPLGASPAGRHSVSQPPSPALTPPRSVVGGSFPALTTSSYTPLISPQLLENFLPPVTTRMDLGGTLLSEISHTEKDKYCMISFNVPSKKKGTNKTETNKQTDS